MVVRFALKRNLQVKVLHSHHHSTTTHLPLMHGLCKCATSNKENEIVWVHAQTLNIISQYALEYFRPRHFSLEPATDDDADQVKYEHLLHVWALLNYRFG